MTTGTQSKIKRVRRIQRDRPLSKQAAIFFLAGPIAFILLSMAGVFFFKGLTAVSFIVSMAVVSVLTGAGKFVILASIAPDAPIGPLGLALLVIAMDTTAAFMLIPVMPLVYRAPVLGKFLCRIRQASRQILSNNSWMSRFTFLGLLTYVAVPVGGTGAIGAVFLGRLLGLRRLPVILGTFLGACLGASLLLVLARVGRESFDALRSNFYLTYGLGISLSLVVIAFAWRVFTTMRANRKNDCPKDDNFDDDDTAFANDSDQESINSDTESSAAKPHIGQLHLVVDHDIAAQNDASTQDKDAPKSQLSS